MSGASSRDQEPTVFTVAALNNINKPFLVNALAKSKANEEAVSESIIAIQKNKKSAICTITPEFGPFPYMPQEPFTRKPLSNQWEINLQMKNYLQQNL